MKKLVSLLLALGMVAFNALADVNINTATQAQLETLHGIGPGKAKAIIDYRAKHGEFKRLADIEKVPGIGPGTFKHIKDDIKLSGETVVKAADKGEHKKAEAKKPAPPKPEPKKAEPPKPEPKKVEPPKPEPKKAEPPKPEPAKPAPPPAKESEKGDKGNKK